jgi:hypothetical protein
MTGRADQFEQAGTDSFEFGLTDLPGPRGRQSPPCKIR